MPGNREPPPGPINHDFDGHLEYPDDGGAADLASVAHDAGPTAATADLAGPAGPGPITGPAMTGCLGEIKCANACPTATAQSCLAGCTANTTTSGDQLFQSLLTCIDAACPGAASSDVCYNPNAAKCSTCVSSSQGASGACGTAQMDCAASTP